MFPSSTSPDRIGLPFVATIESAWLKYPGYAVDVLPFRGTGRARVDEQLLAESTACLIVRESDHRDQLYFPRRDIDATVLADSDHRTVCPFKGEASYASVSVPDGTLENALWWYPTPMNEVGSLRGYAAFYDDRVEVTASIPLADGEEATVRLPWWGTAGDLAALMDVVPLGNGIFTAPTYPNPPLGTFIKMAWHKARRNVIEGGQLMGAAIVAASKTQPDQRVTSAHMAFVKAASFDDPLHVVVDPRRRGSTLSVFDVEVEQAGVLRATGLVMSDSGADDLIRHTVAMPDVPPPAECPRYDFGVLGREIRVVDGAYALDCRPGGPPELYVWTRFASAPESVAAHQALLTQATTHYSVSAALRPHDGISEGDAHRTVSMGPVNASIAFHDEVDVTEWLLTETRSIWAGRGLTQSEVRVFSSDGRLVASKTVQAIVRSFPRTLEQMGHDYSSAM